MASIAEAARRHDSKSREIDLCCELIVNERLRDNSFFPHIPERSFFGISAHKQDRERRLASCHSLALSLLGPKIRVRYRERNDYYAA
jgi:hypothetical protein